MVWIVMMDWSRKHLCDLVGVCKECRNDTALRTRQRKAFADAHEFSKRISSLPNAGDASQILAAIAQSCGGCQSAFKPECRGRTEWHQTYPLIQAHVAALAIMVKIGLSPRCHNRTMVLDRTQ